MFTHVSLNISQKFGTCNGYERFLTFDAKKIQSASEIWHLSYRANTSYDDGIPSID